MIRAGVAVLGPLVNCIVYQYHRGVLPRSAHILFKLFARPSFFTIVRSNLTILMTLYCPLKLTEGIKTNLLSKSITQCYWVNKIERKNLIEEMFCSVLLWGGANLPSLTMLSCHITTRAHTSMDLEDCGVRLSVLNKKMRLGSCLVDVIPHLRSNKTTYTHTLQRDKMSPKKSWCFRNNSMESRTSHLTIFIRR